MNWNSYAASSLVRVERLLAKSDVLRSCVREAGYVSCLVRASVG